MANVAVLNTDASVSAKTVVLAESNNAFSGSNTFSAHQYLAATKRLYLDGGNDTYIYESAANTISLTAGGVSALELTPTAANFGATIPITVGAGQIVFPATQNASTNANTLDDYEEGTWTPVIGGSSQSGQSYTGQTGRYVKIGKFVFASFDVELSNKGTIGAGQVYIHGLPFVSGGNYYTAPFCFWANLAAGWYFIAGILFTGSSSLDIRGIAGAAGAATTSTSLQDTEITNTTRFIGSVCYEV